MEKENKCEKCVKEAEIEEGYGQTSLFESFPSQKVSVKCCCDETEDHE